MPRKWAQKYNLKKGDELDVEEEGNKIVIGTEKAQEPGNIEVDITALDRDSFMFLIRALYIRGYDEIKLVFNNPVTSHHRLGKKASVISEIHSEVNRLTGIEVIQQRENFCILRVLSASSIKEFEIILRRIFLLLTDSSNDFVKGITKSDKYLVESIQEKHNSTTKFIANALRLLNKVGHPNYRDTSLYYHTIESLDIINDTLKESARIVINLNVKISKICEKILYKIAESLEDYNKLFFKFDFNLVEKLSSDRYKILDEIKDSSKKIGKDEVRLLMNMARIIEEIYTIKVTRIALEY